MTARDRHGVRAVALAEVDALVRKAVAYAMPYQDILDSALFGRTGFVTLLDEVEDAGARNVVIVAHSMGAFLTMEGLRQMVLKDGPHALDRLLLCREHGRCRSR